MLKSTGLRIVGSVFTRISHALKGSIRATSTSYVTVDPTEAAGWPAGLMKRRFKFEASLLGIMPTENAPIKRPARQTEASRSLTL